jgi:hypothetical protein
MLSKKLAIIPALVALGVFAMQIDMVSAGPDGGGKNGGDHDGGGKNGGDGGDGGKNGGGDGDGGGHGKNGGGDGDGGGHGKNGGDGGDGGKNGGEGPADDDFVKVRRGANSKAPNLFLAKWKHRQRMRYRCGYSYQQGNGMPCGQVYVTVAEPVYVQEPVRRKHRKARRVAVVQQQQVYDDGYYAQPVVRYVAKPSRAALMQTQKRARRAVKARYQMVDAGCDCVEQQVVVRVKKRKHQRARQVYLPAYDPGAVVHYGPLVDKNGGY